ncbi:hypothetical protein FXW78_01065 [Rhodococcus opacus]|nr:hypothetical protein [Rhodococcus opacus]
MATKLSAVTATVAVAGEPGRVRQRRHRRLLGRAGQRRRPVAAEPSSTAPATPSDISAERLEWQPHRPVSTDWFQGRKPPGVVTESMTIRRTDGTVATAVLLTSNLSSDDYRHHRRDHADPDTTSQLSCAV